MLAWATLRKPRADLVAPATRRGGHGYTRWGAPGSVGGARAGRSVAVAPI